jgi:ATP-dependent RNA helicase DeaD
MNKLETFEELGLSEESLKAIKKKGFEEPSPIQKKTIPALLKGTHDIIGQAQTGTGKTAAFGLPLIEMLEPKAGYVQALILTPTRELAIQVSEEINSLKGRKKLNITPIYGGQSMELQLKRLKQGVDIVVGTPGRIIDHLNRKSLNIDKISFLILDEADEMLNMGFIDDMEEIMKKANPDKRMLLFSATMPYEIKKISKKYMKDLEHIAVEKEQLTTDLTDQIYFEVKEEDKFEALCRIRDVESEFYGIVFCRTKVDVDRVTNKLIDRGYNAEALHGDISQYQRERILNKFKKKQLNILVATDVAARGIDVQDLTHVINYTLPQDSESYVHRIGRTGRAGKEGTAITFVTPEEYRKLVYIKRVTKSDIRKEKLPGIKQLIKLKKERILEDVSVTIKENSLDTYRELAEQLLDSNEPSEVISALLKLNYQDELDESKYKEIKKVTIDKQGKSRLFVALGKTDGYNPKKLVEYISAETGVPSKFIRDVKVFDKFSFITTSFGDAEVILKTFKKNRRGRRPLVEKAKN